MGKETFSSKKHYELSFWFSPQLDETVMEQKLNNLLKDIEKIEGVVIFNQLPQLKQLAYPIKKERNGYFGYLKFDLPSEKLKELKKKLDFSKDILRYLIIKISEKEGRGKMPRKRRVSLLRRKATAPAAKKNVKEEKIDIKELDKKLNEILEK